MFWNFLLHRSYRNTFSATYALLYNVPTNEKATLLRFQTKRQLSRLRSIGIRKRQPKLKESDIIKPNGILTVILGSDVEELPIKKRSKSDRVDFVYGKW